mmetsp:Transcript_98798/g.175949  ORF Transcript_98798/g.175949 Transcript_98798/m.175949 type:complete len:210 (+) Transcript_98798:179-808(+)
MSVLLSSANENNWLACHIHHGQRSSNLVVNRVVLGQKHAIDATRVPRISGHVDQRPVELGHLINRIISHQRLANKKNQVRGVHGYQFCKCPHERLVVLHTASSIYKDDIVTIGSRMGNRIFGDVCRILAIAAFKEWNVQASRVSLQLFNGSSTEGVTGTNQHIQAPFVFQVIRHLGQVGRFADSIHAKKNDCVHFTSIFRSHGRAQHVD